MKEIKEAWKTAVYIFESGVTIEFPGYEVSDQGRVKSKKRNNERILKPAEIKGSDGAIHYQVILRKDNKAYNLLSHRIVLSSFRPKGHPEGYFYGAVADHIVARSEICCNALSNLHWVTQKENVNTEHYKVKQSEKQLNNPKKSKCLKVTDHNTNEITEYPSVSEASRALGIRQSTLSICIRKYNGFYKKGNLSFSYI